METRFNAKGLLDGLEESDVPAALTHSTDVYLQRQRLALRLVPSLSGTTGCSADLSWLTLPTFEIHVTAFPEFHSEFILSLIHI